MKPNYIQKMISAILLLGLCVPFPAQKNLLPSSEDKSFAAEFSASAGNLAPEQTGVFSNTAPIMIPGIGGGLATNINVSGLPGTITRVTVTFNGINHGNPDDIDVLMVAPTGNRNLIVMSDAGGISDLTGTVLTLSDAASNLLTDEGFIGDGAQTFRPANHEGAGDAFNGFFGTTNSAAPSGGQTLGSQFGGINPNGLWSLYVMDDANPSVGGSIANGWSITIETNSVVNATDDAVDAQGCSIAHCSLREAVSDSPPGGLITFAPALAGQVITLAGTQISINKNLMLDASALPPRVSVSGNNFSRVFNVEAGAVVVMNNLIIANGRVVSTPSQPERGGGIQNNGTLTLENCLVTNNSATANAAFPTAFSSGGGIFSTGTLTLNNSVVRENQVVKNSADSTLLGGGIALSSFQPTVINNTRIQDNRIIGGASRNGGGIYNAGGGSLLVTNSSIDNNTSNGGLGGGLFNQTGSFILTNATIYNNSAFGGGGVLITDGSGLIVNSTVSANSATFTGGVTGGNLVRLRNSIVAGNTAPNAPDILGAISLGNNLIGSTAGNGSTVFQPTDITNPPTAGLGAFGANGGATPIVPLVPNSPAINAGNNCVLTNNCGDNFDLGFNLTTDGRGAGFPRQFGTSNIDIGAFESSVPTAASVSIGGRIFDANGRGAARTVVLLTNSAGETRAAFTNPFGFYRFADVPAGETYIVAPRHKQFGFAPQVLFVDGARDDLDFIAVAP